MDAVTYDKVLDARGLSCPLPIVKARQELTTLQPGQVLKVLATDRGSVKDFQGWAQTAKNIVLLGQNTEADNGQEIYVHYVQKKA
ncbi:MAG TPA: sulfurtransferase TusA family protein [Candidatus Tectomicrobia bacterium]|nr:sulfurtransferase TusA family protein [Candidatus Tectomicrobia bacterium]